MFAVAFTLILLLVNIYCWRQKKYLPLYIVCMIFLPDYYGVAFDNQALPVISVSRIILVAFLIYAIIYRKCSLKEAFIFSWKKAFLFWAFVLFRIASNLYYITTYDQALKTIFVILIEQALFMVAITLLNPDRSEIIGIIKSVVVVASIYFYLGIFESFTGLRLFDLLYTVNRDMLDEYHYRMGVLKATASFGLPGFFGDMCVVVLPLIFYCYRLTKNRAYLFSVALDVMAVIHSGSRASIMFFMLICFAYIVLRIFSDKHEWLELLKNASGIVIFLTVVMLIIGSISPKFQYFYTGTAKSILNVVGFEFDLDEGATEESGGYGENVDGTYSRTVQFTGLKYAYSVNPVFGLGSGAQVRGDVRYFKRGEWRTSYTYDVGYVEIFMDEGFLGLIGYICLAVFALCGILSIRRNDKDLAGMLFLCTMAYFLCLLATANVRSLMVLVYSLIYMCSNNITKKI